MKTLRNVVPVAVALGALAGPIANAAVTYSSGHADIGVGYEDGGLHLHLHAEGAVVDGSVVDEEFEPGDVIIQVPEAVMSTTSSSLPFLDVQAGESVWTLPTSQNPAAPFLGWGTEELNPAEWGAITFSLGTVTSPSGNGNFAVWSYDSFSNLNLAMSTADGSAPNFFEMAAGVHQHYNLGFTEAGIWSVELTASGVHQTDGEFSSTETFTFSVIPEPSVALLGAIGALGLLRRRR